MKIVRYFLWEDGTDSWSGITGWTPMWIPRSAGFDPSEGRGIIHDAFEHSLTDTGTFEQEVQAFGRIIALRMLSGLAAEGMFRQTPEEAFGHELADIYERAGNPTIKRAPPCSTHGYIASSVQVMCRRFADRAEADQAGINAVAGWLNVGYRDAIRRYGGQKQCDSLGWTCHYAADRLNKVHGTESHQDVLRLCLDTNHRFDLSWKVLTPDWEYGRQPYWLRQRINNWTRH